LADATRQETALDAWTIKCSLFRLRSLRGFGRYGREGFQMATRKSASHSHRSSGGQGKRKVHKVMKEHKEGTLKSSSGKKVKSRKQAVAIALSEARRSGAKIPKKKKS
jgi:lysozyme family protein